MKYTLIIMTVVAALGFTSCQQQQQQQQVEQPVLVLPTKK